MENHGWYGTQVSIKRFILISFTFKVRFSRTHVLHLYEFNAGSKF